MSLHIPMTAAEAATVKVRRTCVTVHSFDLEPSSRSRSSGASFFEGKTKEPHVLVWGKKR